MVNILWHDNQVKTKRKQMACPLCGKLSRGTVCIYMISSGPAEPTSLRHILDPFRTSSSTSDLGPVPALRAVLLSGASFLLCSQRSLSSSLLALPGSTLPEGRTAPASLILSTQQPTPTWQALSRYPSTCSANPAPPRSVSPKEG